MSQFEDVSVTEEFFFFLDLRPHFMKNDCVLFKFYHFELTWTRVLDDEILSCFISKQNINR